MEHERLMDIFYRDDDNTAQYWFVAVMGPEIVGFVLHRLYAKAGMQVERRDDFFEKLPRSGQG